MCGINQDFSINGLEYSTWINLNGEFSFGLVTGDSRKGAVYRPNKINIMERLSLDHYSM